MFHYYLIGILSFSLIFTNRAYIESRIVKLKNLYSLVKSHHRNILTVIWVMASILLKRAYLIVFQYLNKTIVQLDKNTFELTYSIGDNVYKIILKYKRGPRRVILVVDENFTDLTDEMQMYIGPNEDFHHHKFTPEFFGRENLTFQLSTGEERTFSQREVIHIF